MTTTTPEIEAAIEHFAAAEVALKEITTSADSLRSTEEELDATRGSVSDAAQQLEESAEAWNNIAVGLEAVTIRIKEASELLQQAQPEALRASVETQGEMIRGMTAGILALETAVGKLQDEVAATSKTLTGGLAAATDQLSGLRTRMSDELASVNSQIGRATDSIASLGDDLESLEQAETDRYDDITSRFEQASNDMTASFKWARTAIVAVGIVAGASFAGTIYLVIQSLG